MRTLFPLVLVILTGCQTLYTPDGRKRTVLSPIGESVANTVIATGVGAGAGALMNNAPGWATGAVGAGTGSIASQIANSILPTRANTPVEYQPLPPKR